MKKHNDIENELFFIDWKSPEIFRALCGFKEFEESDIAFALILFNFVELDSSVFTNSTERFAEAINISLAQIAYVKTLSSIVDPIVH